MNRIALTLLFVLLGLGLGLAQDGTTGPSTDTSGASPTDVPTIAEILYEREDVSTFFALLEETGIIAELGDPGVFTVFAPTDAAFERLFEEVGTEFLAREGVIGFVLRNHMAMGGSSSDVLENMGTLTNIAGFQYFITPRDDLLLVNEAVIVGPDLEASNGVVHVIDTVLVPEPYWPKKNQSTIPSGGTSGGTD